MIRAAARAAFAAALAACPLLLALVPEQHLPSGLAYLVHDGRAVIALVAGLVLVNCLASKRSVPSEAGPFQRINPSWLSLALAAGAFLVALLLTPESRWNGDGLGGDEPKYLRIAESLLQDLDVDVKSQSQAEWTVRRFSTNFRRLLRDIGDAAKGLFTAENPPEGHRWSLGNWTLRGSNGGEYYVQSPGLPLLLLPSLVLREILDLPEPPSFLPTLTLVLLWTFALVQTTKLASEVSGSRPAGLAAGIATSLSAPLLIGGFHFYPESAAAALVPWLVRHGRTGGPATRSFTAAMLGLGCGFLPWLHPKFLLTALVLLALLVWKLRTNRLSLGLLLSGAALGLATLLLFDHHVTGLLTPDALYRRYGSAVYRGPGAFLSPLLLNGLVTALFGARDGILVMAPVLLGGVLAIEASWRNDRRATLELAAVFASLWLAAAVHEGGAPGPPGRLMAPVACTLAALLAVGLARLSRNLGYVLTAATLAALTLAITGGMLGDWRRTVNPYRKMFTTPARDFAKDLPDGPGRPDAPYETHKSRDRWRGVVLIALLAAWAVWFARHPESPARPIEWRAARWALGLWATLGVAAFALSALGP